jgi:hypothetical protein
MSSHAQLIRRGYRRDFMPSGINTSAERCRLHIKQNPIKWRRDYFALSGDS